MRFLVNKIYIIGKFQILFFLVLFVIVPTAYTHSGRTDAQGGHTNKKTGEYLP